MCGTTSMPLSSFVIAKIAALPLMLLYVFIGASMGTLLGGGGGSGGGAGSPAAAAAAAVEVQQIEENEYLIASGILLSVVMITCITRQVKRELNKVRRLRVLLLGFLRHDEALMFFCLLADAFFSILSSPSSAC
jgi:uncharacterized membrane protein YdjX (TVP38/TMEM64 family)